MKRVGLCCIAAAVVLTSARPALAQRYQGAAVTSGQAAFTHGGKDLAFGAAEGGFHVLQGFMVATLVFRPVPKSAENTHLNLTLVYRAPGKVDLDGAFSMSGLAMFSDGDVSRFAKGKSRCAITLTKATATEVEGTGACPLLHNNDGEAKPPLTNLKFSATVR